MALYEGVAIGLHLELCGDYYMAAFKRLTFFCHGHIYIHPNTFSMVR